MTAWSLCGNHDSSIAEAVLRTAIISRVRFEQEGKALIHVTVTESERSVSISMDIGDDLRAEHCDPDGTEPVQIWGRNNGGCARVSRSM